MEHVLPQNSSTGNIFKYLKSVPMHHLKNVGACYCLICAFVTGSHSVHQDSYGTQEDIDHTRNDSSHAELPEGHGETVTWTS